MKTVLKISLLLVVFFSASLKAQDNETGIRASVNFSNWYTDGDVTDENIKVGFSAGFFHRAFLSDLVSIQPGLEFSQKGSTFTYNNIFGEGEIRGILNYIELPVLVNIHPSELFHLGAGAYAGTLLSAKSEFVDEDGDPQGDEEFDRDNFTTLDYGLIFDLGLDFEAITVGARYNLGLNDVVWDTTFGDVNLGKNSVFQVYVGFAF